MRNAMTIQYDLERARQAVQVLVESPYAIQHIKKLRTVVQQPRALPFRGDLEPLNELLVIGRQRSQAMDNLVDVALIKRGGTGATYRNEYQRRYMAEKRARDRKVVELEQLLVGRKLSLDERRAALLRQYSIWNKERTRFLSTVANLPWPERMEHLHAFWAAREQELDDLIDVAKKQTQKVVHRKRVVVVNPPPPRGGNTKLYDALKGIRSK